MKNLIKEAFKLKAKNEIIFSARMGIIGFIIPTLISANVSPVIIGWGLTIALLGNMIRSRWSNSMLHNIEHNNFIIALTIIGDVLFSVLLILMTKSKTAAALFFVYQGISFLFYTPLSSLIGKIERTHMSGGRLGIISQRAKNKREFINSLIQLLFLQANIAIFYFLEYNLAVLVCVIINTVLNVADTIVTIKIVDLYKNISFKKINSKEEL